MSSISFDNAWLLLLAVPLVVLFTVPFFIAVRKDNANGHNIASGIIHIIMAVIIAFVAAGTSIITTVTQTDVYVLADVSYSTSRNLDAVDGYIADLGKSLPNNSRMGVICFGKDYQLLTRLGERVKSVKQADVDDSSTDIIGALDYAGSLFRDDVIKRIVLITDGKQTNESDSNAFKRQVDALADRKIHVDAIYIDANLKDGAREVQLSDVQFTNTTCLNRDGESVQVTIDCSCPETMDDGQTAYVTEAVLTLNK
ncbi:MAG: VWA domain-containing protein, partial [Clostridia bacterium]|nr:VWA domain-containing protein [Clostridia bacterium]